MNLSLSFSHPAVAVLAFAIVVLLVPLVRRLCTRWQLHDAPGPLKIHANPVPRLGGIALACGLAIPLALAALAPFSHADPVSAVWPFFAALCLVWFTGFIDDLRGLSPLVRVIAQIGAAAFLWQGGWRMPWFASGALGLAALALFVVVCVNAFNFLDGSDAIASAVAVVIAVCYVLQPGAFSSAFESFVAVALLGASCGFLFYNAPPAKIFMGDSGSNALGFLVAFLALGFYRANAPTPTVIAFPLVVAGLPLLDAALAILRRLQNRSSPFYGDRRHFYDLLLARGWSSRRVALLCAGITAALCLTATACLPLRGPSALIVSGTAVGLLLVLCVKLGSLRANDEKARLQDGATHNSALLN